MTDKELLKLFRRAQVFVAELIEIGPQCEAEIIQWSQAKHYCKRLEKVADELREIRLNPGKDIQHLVNVGLITQQEKVNFTRDYNKHKNDIKKIYNTHPKKGGKPSNPGGGNPGGGNPGGGNPGQGGGPP